MDNMLKDFIRLMRPHQWYKNLVIFVALVFSHNLASISLTTRVVYGFVLLCLMSSVIYIINDIKDAEKDKKHPQKKRRPIPSGAVTKKQAWLFGLFLFIFVSYLSFIFDKMFFFGLMVFFLLGLCYSVKLKQIFILDVIVISINFVLRAFLGGLLIHVPVSLWLILCTFLLAMILALGKRKAELDMLGSKSISHRIALRMYSSDDKRLLNSFITFSLSTLFISYAIYCIMKGEELMIITMPVALFLLFRYMYFVSCRKEICASPSKIFKDKQMLLGIILWIVMVIIINMG